MAERQRHWPELREPRSVVVVVVAVQIVDAAIRARAHAVAHVASQFLLPMLLFPKITLSLSFQLPLAMLRLQLPMWLL
jgi:hypothetical protein